MSRSGISARVVRSALAAVLLGALASGPAAADEAWPADRADALMSRIKTALLERRWSDAEAACALYLAHYPDSPHAAAVTFQRGRALSSLGGRHADALEAYTEAARRAGKGSDLEREARRAACGAAWSMVAAEPPPRDGAAAGPERRRGLSALARCLRDVDRGVRVYAAVVAARIDDAALRREAAAVLAREIPEETDPDVRDEMALALARVDPSAAGEAAGTRAAARNEDRRARWIHLRITSRTRPEERVEINLPIAFARALLDSLPEAARGDLRSQAEEMGLSWEALSSALADLESAERPLLSVDDGDETIEVWID